jgi:hypothetical protein
MFRQLYLFVGIYSELLIKISFAGKGFERYLKRSEVIGRYTDFEISNYTERTLKVA